MRKDIRLIKKNSVIDVIIKPSKHILDSENVEVVDTEDEIKIKVLKDIYILGSKSGTGWLRINHTLEVIDYNKPSISVTPWEAMSNKLKEVDFPLVRVGRGTEPLHYRDEMCIPYSLDERDGKFYIIHKEEALRYINREPLAEELKSGRKKYYTKKTKLNISLSTKLGIKIENKINLSEDIGMLSFIIVKNTGEEVIIPFDIDNKQIDTYRFLSIFDGNEYDHYISKKEIEESLKIIIKTYKNKSLQEKICFVTKELI